MDNFLKASSVVSAASIIRETMGKRIGINKSHGKEKGQPVG
jgi:hypothetical protein